jgi:KaiC/GvpD/RAD55 family RecA-like ATPase/intein/homing endonuclease
MTDRLNTGVHGLDDKMQGGFVDGSVNLVTGKTGTGKCVTAGTPIVLSSGEIKTAKEIFDIFHSGDENEIWVQPNNLELPSLNPKTMKIEPKKVKFLYRQKITENIIKIRTTSGREIEITKAHPFVSLRNGEIIYKKATEIKRGNFVAIPRTIKKSGLINDGGVATQDMSSLTKFLALQIAEGDEWMKKSYYLRFCNKDEQMLKYYFDLSKNLFDYEPKRYEHKNKTPTLRIFSKEVIERLKCIGFEPKLLSRHKKIPEFILKLPDEITAEFLRTFFDCEASVSKKNSAIELSTASYDIANKITFMLLRFGIIGRIKKKRKFATNGKKIKRNYFEVIISGGEQLRKFYQNINFGIESKRKKLEICLKKKSGTNVDVIPDVGGLLKEVRKMLNIPATKMKEIGCKQTIYMYEWGKRNPTTRMLNKFIAVFKRKLFSTSMECEEVNRKIKDLEVLANSDIFWDKVRSAKEVIPSSPYVYDFTIEDNHTFIGGLGGIITHNTAFCASFLYAGAQKNEPGVYVTTEEPVEDIREDIKSMFNWDMEELEKKKIISFLVLEPVIPVSFNREEEMSRILKIYVYDLYSKIEETVKKMKAKRLVIDSSTIIEMFIQDDYLRRVALMKFVNDLKKLRITTVISGTVPEGTDLLSVSGIIEFFVDSVVKLEFMPVAEEFKRTLTIRKMRRTDHSIYIHPFEITKTGLKVIEIK